VDRRRGTPGHARAVERVLAHHERPDGHGYPRGLRDGDIPLESQIVAVADAYAAMTSDYGPRERMDPQSALAELRANAGTQFSKEVVAAFVALDPTALDQTSTGSSRRFRQSAAPAQRDAANSTK
jgi:HD-GYP domain-containing protein (c-di-GMP phosphodiesterase class II)